MNEEEQKIVGAMEEFGGSFVRSLAKCFWRADPENFKKLKDTFSGYWEAYKKISKEPKKYV
jgi:hypothetical protein